MENIILKSEEMKSRIEVVQFLKEITKKIEEGTVKLIQGDEEVTLAIPENLILELKVEEKIKPNKPKKMLLEIELEWIEGEKKESIKLG